jgi:hypothetical protein
MLESPNAFLDMRLGDFRENVVQIIVSLRPVLILHAKLSIEPPS